MTREEAIKRLNHYRYCLDFQFGWFGEDDNEAIDMAIEALTELKMREQYTKNYETDEYVKFGVTNKNKDKVILYDAFGEVEYYPTNRKDSDCWGCNCPKIERDMAIAPTIPMFAESEEAYEKWTGENMGRPHGRLIDADKLEKQLDTVYNEMANERERKGLRLARWFLISAPTVSADIPQGEWINKDVVQNEDNPIGEWQECQCSVCGKWHTTPYMYYFNNYNYCPNCGALMGGDGE